MTRYGDRASCKHCGQDIEFTGMKGWRDRGGNRSCVPYADRKTGEIVTPTTKHAPYVSALPPETPNDREALRLQIEHATQMEALASWRERGFL